MNTEFQLDPHPDTESLSAFAEQLLPDRERQPILAHLATCARCRQILSLAQDSADAAEQPAPAAPFLLPSVRKNPLAGSRFAWGALAACAALVALTVFLYPHPRAAAPEQAKVLSNRPTDAPAPLSPGPAKTPPGQLQSSRPKSLPTQVPGTKSARPTPSAPAPEQTPAQAQGAATVVSTLNASPAPAALAQAGQIAADSAAPKPSIPSTSQTVNVAVDNAAVQPLASPITATMPVRQELPANQMQLKASSVKPLGATNASSGAEPVPSSSANSQRAFAKMASSPLTVTPEDESIARETLHRTLPSGLPAVATASASHRLLAVDSAGAVFLSEDAGQVWEPVPHPWSGRAAGVQLAGAAIQTAAAQTAGRPVQPISFEIVTENGVRWTSIDGRIWKEK